MAGTILAVVDDLLFLSKIQQTAQQVGAAVEAVSPARLEERLGQVSASAVIFDLNHRSGSIGDVLRAMKSNPLTKNIQTVGFVSHVQGDLIEAARAAGCDVVLARSAFSQGLPKLLEDLAGKDTAANQAD